MSGVRTEVLLWAAQRASAFFLAFFVAVHLAVIVYAVHRGLTAQAILARTEGNVAWATFYILFVLAVAVHVPIGLRSIGVEWLRWRGRSLNYALVLVGAGLAVLGLRAVYAVFA